LLVRICTALTGLSRLSIDLATVFAVKVWHDRPRDRLVAALTAIGDYYDYRMSRNVNWLERKQNAMAITPFAQEMESARGVHPDTAAMLINERHRVWMLKSGQASEGIPPHSVLFDAPQVTDIFLMHFLKHSNKKTILPKRMLVDGRKNRFDPLGQVTEYEMYDRLVELLERKGMIRKYNDFQIHEFIFPWDPQLVAEDYGLEWEQPAKAELNNQKEKK